MNTNTVDSEFLGTYQPEVVFAYSFEVVLPCSLWDIGNLMCDINYDGKVHVHGTTKGGEISGRSSPIVFNRRLHRISPPAPFCISFSLPGPVEPYFNRKSFTADGSSISSLQSALRKMNTNTVDSEFLGTYQPEVVFAYSFEVVLPCSLWDIGNLMCDINYDGKVQVHGTTKGGEISGRSSPIVFNRRLRRISPPAPFCISFSLPGPVEPYFNRKSFTADGSSISSLQSALRKMNTNTVDSEFLGTYQPEVVFAYSFEVVLPCSLWDIGNLMCDINYDGKVQVHGTTKGGEISGRSSPIVFNRRLRRISPPAPFCISFSLPGPVEPYFNRKSFTADVQSLYNIVSSTKHESHFEVIGKIICLVDVNVVARKP
ncbi:hypothetical protein ACJIZ3_019350 [Penstemon smallii]|uniref:Uncharacterized protein n=1 Tax=Penstemon smallii TaxID=265156 RepID=A0ABD3T262_9LAMI